MVVADEIERLGDNILKVLADELGLVVADEVERLGDNIIKVLADELGMLRADEVEWCFEHVGFYSCRARCIGREHKGSACGNES